jgi:hypothetical protein
MCYIFWVCVCSVRYPACNAHVPYCHLSPAPLYSIFPHYLINGTIFEKKLLNTKCAFWFSLQLLSETFLIAGRTERDVIKHVYWSLCKAPWRYSCQGLRKREFSQLFFRKKSSNIKVNENPSSRSRVVPCWRTDGQLFRLLRKIAEEPKHLFPPAQ